MPQSDICKIEVTNTILNLQLSKSDYKRLLHKPYVNEVALTGQNPLLNRCQPPELLTQFKGGLDLLMLKIVGLKVKGLQSCRLSNFENDSTPSGLEPGPNAIAHTSAGMAEAADFFLRTPTLTATNFKAL